MKPGRTFRPLVTVGAECCPSRTAMLKFTAGETPQLCSLFEASSDLPVQVHFTFPAAGIFTLSGTAPPKTKSNHRHLLCGGINHAPSRSSRCWYRDHRDSVRAIRQQGFTLIAGAIGDAGRKFSF